MTEFSDFCRFAAKKITESKALLRAHHSAFRGPSPGTAGSAALRSALLQSRASEFRAESAAPWDAWWAGNTLGSESIFGQLINQPMPRGWSPVGGNGYPEGHVP